MTALARLDTTCPECGEAVDEDGLTLYECPVNPVDPCPGCGACVHCDGSC